MKFNHTNILSDCRNIDLDCLQYTHKFFCYPPPSNADKVLAAFDRHSDGLTDQRLALCSRVPRASARRTRLALERAGLVVRTNWQERNPHTGKFTAVYALAGQFDAVNRNGYIKELVAPTQSQELVISWGHDERQSKGKHLARAEVQEGLDYIENSPEASALEGSIKRLEGFLAAETQPQPKAFLGRIGEKLSNVFGRMTGSYPVN